jgi:hypothetical protein
LSTIPGYFYSVYTDIFGETYTFSEDVDIAKNISKVKIIRPHALDGSLNSPTEIYLINNDDNIIGFFTRVEDSILDNDEPEPITGGEDIPDVDGQNDFPLPDVTGEG